MQDEWKPHTEIDWNDKTILLYNIDTRDFHCAEVRAEDFGDVAEGKNPKPNIDLSTLKKYSDRFFYTDEEAKAAVANLFERTGGKAEWRCIWFQGEGEKVSDNWGMKYLRIHRTKYGLLICNNKHYAINKNIFNSKISEEILSAH